MKAMRKISRGTGFRGALNYVLDKNGIIIGGNMSGTNARELAHEFGTVRIVRTDIEKPVWHNALRLPQGEKLSAGTWNKIVVDYMQRLGFKKNQYAVVLHDEQVGQHVHIIANRINLDGTVYLGQNENLKSTKIVQQLEKKFNLTITPGPDTKSSKIGLKKGELEMAIRTGVEPVKMRLSRKIKSVLRGYAPCTAVQFVKLLNDQDVKVKANVASTGRLSGFSFSADGAVWVKGSQLKLSWKKLQDMGVKYNAATDAAELRQNSNSTSNVGSNGNSGKNRPDNGNTREIFGGADTAESKTRQRVAPAPVPTNKIVKATKRKKPTVRKTHQKQEVQQYNSRWIERDIIDRVKCSDPAAFLMQYGFEVKAEGKYYDVRLGGCKMYRISKKIDGVWIYTDKTGRRGGDLLAFCKNELNIGTLYEQVRVLSGGQTITTVIRQEAGQEQEKYPHIPQERNISAGFEYLKKRGISEQIIKSAHGAWRALDDGILFIGRDSAGQIRSATKRGYEGTKRDFKNSDKRYPCILNGDKSVVVVVEGGVDGLAVQDMARDAGHPIPTVIITGGAGLRAWIETKQIRDIIVSADKVIVTGDNDDEIKGTQEQHQQQADKIMQTYGVNVDVVYPPEQFNDWADYWIAKQEQENYKYSEEIEDNKMKM